MKGTNDKKLRDHTEESHDFVTLRCAAEMSFHFAVWIDQW